MKIVTYAARRYEQATRKALRGEGKMFTCPPLTDAAIQRRPDLFEGADLVVFNLHGFANSPAWLGGDGKDDGVPAMMAHTLRSLPLAGAGVFAINCYLGDQHSPMRDALRRAGALWVISGEGVNYGGINEVAGADILLAWFTSKWSPGSDPRPALREAKIQTLRGSPKRSRADQLVLVDTLSFGVFFLE